MLFLKMLTRPRPQQFTAASRWFAVPSRNWHLWHAQLSQLWRAWRELMGGQVIRLPSRFPVGTRYVIEGREGLIRLRYLEFPDGRKVDLPADLAGRTKARSAIRARRETRKPGEARQPGRKK
jgi:hypothetical protein